MANTRCKLNRTYKAQGVLTVALNYFYYTKINRLCDCTQKLHRVSEKRSQYTSFHIFSKRGTILTIFAVLMPQ